MGLHCDLGWLSLRCLSVEYVWICQMFEKNSWTAEQATKRHPAVLNGSKSLFAYTTMFWIWWSRRSLRFKASKCRNRRFGWVLAAWLAQKFADFRLVCLIWFDGFNQLSIYIYMMQTCLYLPPKGMGWEVQEKRCFPRPPCGLGWAYIHGEVVYIYIYIIYIYYSIYDLYSVYIYIYTKYIVYT